MNAFLSDGVRHLNWRHYMSIWNGMVNTKVSICLYSILCDGWCPLDHVFERKVLLIDDNNISTNNRNIIVPQQHVTDHAAYLRKIYILYKCFLSILLLYFNNIKNVDFARVIFAWLDNPNWRPGIAINRKQWNWQSNEIVFKLITYICSLIS